MIPIYTKRLIKKWFCFATFDCYDYMYTGKTKEEAQNKMKKRLTKSGLEGHGLFMAEEIHIKDKTSPSESQIGYARSRIDNNPIA